MENNNKKKKYLVIGAGVSGLCAAKQLQAYGIAFEGVEANNDIGGLWSLSPEQGPLYKNTHAISPKQLQGFKCFPMPADYPDFPHHSLLNNYLRAYAEKFDLYKHFEFGKKVAQLEKIDDYWRALFADGEERFYAGVIIASGHHDEPYMPYSADGFKGEVLHSKQYYHPKQFNGKKVLIIGSGQSAVDALMDACTSADKVYHSFRTPLFCFPRYFLGRPLQTFFSTKLKIPFRKYFVKMITPFVKLLGRTPKRCHLQQYDFKIGFPIPIGGEELLNYYAQQDITPKPEVSHFEGNKVFFKDNTHIEVDLVFFATGYKVTFPFLPKKYLVWPEEDVSPHMYLHVFHPDIDNLFTVGLLQVIGSHWDLYDYQAQSVSAYLKAKKENPQRVEKFDQLKKSPQPDLMGGVNLRNRKERMLTVEKTIYREIMVDILKQFGYELK